MPQLHQTPEVVSRLKLLRPKLPRKLNEPLLVAPRTKRYGLIGNAFDYLLRCELKRRAPGAINQKWAAEKAPSIAWDSSPPEPTTHGRLMGWGMELMERFPEHERLPPEEVGDRLRTVLQKCRSVYEEYVTRDRVSRAQAIRMASACVQLAKLDAVTRARYLDPTVFSAPDMDDVGDIIDMLRIVPFNSFLSADGIQLNPHFEAFPCDADLIIDRQLIDIKTTKKPSATAVFLDQLLAYFLVIREDRRKGIDLPDIDQFGLYFGRFGALWSVPAAVWTEHPEFSATEKWFSDWLQASRLPPKRAAASNTNISSKSRRSNDNSQNSQIGDILRIGESLAECPDCRSKPELFSTWTMTIALSDAQSKPSEARWYVQCPKHDCRFHSRQSESSTAGRCASNWNRSVLDLASD